MQNGVGDEGKFTTQQLRPLVLIVIAAKLAVSALLLTTVQFPAPVSTPEIAALR
jgi:hypothetical protein